jgi:hypothetical protein
MTIFLNNSPLDLELKQYQNFKELLSYIEKNLVLPSGEVLTRIRLNGRELTEEEEGDSASLPVEKINELNLFSRAPKDLALESLSDIMQLMPEVHKELNGVIFHLNAGNDSQGYEKFVLIADGLQLFMSVFSPFMQIFEPQLKNLSDQNFVETAQKIMPLSTEILKAYQEKDKTTIIDLLEYELKPLIENLNQQFEPFITEIKNV